MHAFASSWTSRRNQLHMCYTISIRIASLLAHADVWICSFIVFLACVGFIDPSCDFVVLVYLFLVASSISRIKLILNHEILQQSNGRTVQWDATHQGSNPGARTFSWDFLRICRCCALSGKRHSHRQRGANGDFENLQICRILSPSEVLIG
jgi:hypothetical protein